MRVLEGEQGLSYRLIVHSYHLLYGGCNDLFGLGYPTFPPGAPHVNNGT